MSSTIYELREYDYLYDDIFYYQFKNDETVVARVKGFFRWLLDLDEGSFERDREENMRILHLIKSVRSVDELVEAISGTRFSLREKELL